MKRTNEPFFILFPFAWLLIDVEKRVAEQNLLERAQRVLGHAAVVAKVLTRLDGPQDERVTIRVARDSHVVGGMQNSVLFHPANLKCINKTRHLTQTKRWFINVVNTK